ncbi:MAG: hypothetical protein ACRDSM_02945 [Pseudonocardiaceae bacterium]
MSTTKTSDHTNNTVSPSTPTQAILDGRHADTTRRRQRVLTALDRARTEGAEINASGIARAAGVDRTFLYPHRDLLQKIHALAAEPLATTTGAGPIVTRASLQADLLAAHERTGRLHTRVQHLEKRLSEALGEQAWRASGLGAPDDINALNQQITHFEQQIIDLRQQLTERDEDLAAARATNRELMTRINHTNPNK